MKGNIRGNAPGSEEEKVKDCSGVKVSIVIMLSVIVLLFLALIS